MSVEEFPLKRFMATVRGDGRVTIPKEIRQVHGIREGCIVELRLVQIVSKKLRHL